MSSSSFCIEQREKEQAILRTFLAYSIVGSAVFHVVAAFGFDLLWPKGSHSADKPIEFILVDAPKAEIKQPEEKVQPPTPKPTPKPTVTPKAIVTPKPIEPPKPDLFTPPPIPVAPKLPEKPPEVVQPSLPPPEPIAPKPQVVPPQPKVVTTEPIEEAATTPEPLPPPRVPRQQPLSTPTPEQVPQDTPPQPVATSQPLQARSPRSRSFRNNVTQSTPANTTPANTTDSNPLETSPEAPGSAIANQPPTPQRSTTANNQPLQASAGNRQFRDNFSSGSGSGLDTNPSTNSSEDINPFNPGGSGGTGETGGVVANRGGPSRPTVNSQPLGGSGSGNRGFRDNFSSGSGSGFGTNPSTNSSEDINPFNPGGSGGTGGVAANRGGPSRPTVNSQPLGGYGSGNRGFRDNFSSGSGSGFGTNPSTNSSEDINPFNPGGTGGTEGTGGVAANRGSPSRPTVNSQPLGGSGSGNRGFRDNFSSGSGSGLDTNSSEDINPFNPGGSGGTGGVAANRGSPSRPTVNSQPLGGSGSGNRGFRDSFSSGSGSGLGSGSGSGLNSDFSPTGSGTSRGVASRDAPPRPANRGSGGRRGLNGVRCIRGCDPQFPDSLANTDIEGRPVVEFVVEANGSTSEAKLIESSGNGELDRVAVEAVAKMRFSPPQGGRASVELAINFATSGSDFERQARRRREENERLRRERERQQSPGTGSNLPQF